MDDDLLTPHDHMVGIRAKFRQIEASLRQLDPYTLEWLYIQANALADEVAQSQYGDLAEPMSERIEILEPSM